jgi:hypothetical protein
MFAVAAVLAFAIFWFLLGHEVGMYRRNNDQQRLINTTSNRNAHLLRRLEEEKEKGRMTAKVAYDLGHSDGSLGLPPSWEKSLR